MDNNKKTCPHCKGKTTCKCFTCVQQPHNVSRHYITEGICKVCKGLGEVAK